MDLLDTADWNVVFRQFVNWNSQVLNNRLRGVGVIQPELKVALVMAFHQFVVHSNRNVGILVNQSLFLNTPFFQIEQVWVHHFVHLHRPHSQFRVFLPVRQFVVVVVIGGRVGENHFWLLRGEVHSFFHLIVRFYEVVWENYRFLLRFIADKRLEILVRGNMRGIERLVDSIVVNWRHCQL